MVKGVISLKLMIIISSVMGAVGFIIWGFGLLKYGASSAAAWAGGVIVAFISFLLIFISRWLKW